MRIVILMAAVLSAGLAGCVAGGTAPFVHNDPLRGQSKVTHAVNWHELAHRAIAALPSSGERLPVYVNSGPDVYEPSPFAQVYRQFLEEELLKANYPVAQTAGAGITIEFNIHPLEYPHTVRTWRGETNAEVVVSTRVADRNHVHYLRTETVYVRPVDLTLYTAPEPGLPIVMLPVNPRDH